MLIRKKERLGITPRTELYVKDELSREVSAGQRRVAKMLDIEWLGQMLASIFWIVSVFAYGISSSGDYLQLCAASAWFLANIASIVNVENP